MILKQVLKLAKFGLVGLVASLSYALFAYICIWFVGFNETLSGGIAYLLAIPISFFGQKYFTFNSKGKVNAELPRFILLQVLCLMATLAITYTSNELLGLHPNFGILAVCVLLPPMSYLIMSLMIFRQNYDINMKS